MNMLSLLSQYIHIEGAVLTLLILFLLGLIYMIVEATSLVRSLNKVQSLTMNALKGSAYIDAESLYRVNQDLESNAFIGHAWKEFHETILQEAIDGKTKVYNTKSISYFFRKSHLLEVQILIIETMKIMTLSN